MTRTYKIGLFLVLLLIGVTVSGATSYAGGVELSIPPVAQAKTNWCWAAVGNRITWWHSQEKTQCQVADATTFNSCSQNWQSTLGYLNDGLYNLIRVSGYYLESQISWSTVVDDISNARPIGFRVVLPIGGHIMLLTGYDEDMATGAKTVIYIDSADAQRKEKSWTSFTTKTSDWDWTHTLDRIMNW